MVVKHANSLTANYLNSGWNYATPQTANVQAMSVDSEVCRGLKCKKCGSEGMDCTHLVSKNGSRYVPIAVCGNCGFEVEI